MGWHWSTDHTLNGTGLEDFYGPHDPGVVHKPCDGHSLSELPFWQVLDVHLDFLISLTP